MARKICAISGDARRLLEVAKRAVELAFLQHQTNSVSGTSKQNYKEFISVATVQKAIAEIFSSSTSPKLLKNLSFHQQLMLICAGNIAKKSGLAEIALQECI